MAIASCRAKRSIIARYSAMVRSCCKITAFFCTLRYPKTASPAAESAVTFFTYLNAAPASEAGYIRILLSANITAVGFEAAAAVCVCFCCK